jgi:hypothetical protein
VGFVVKNAGARTDFVPLLRFSPVIMITVRSVFMFSKRRMALTTEKLVQTDNKFSDEMQPTWLDASIRTFSCGYIHIFRQRM